MNFLLLNNDEINEDVTYGLIKTDKLKFISERYVLDVGKTINVGLIGGNRGEGIIEKVSKEEIMIKLSLNKAPLKKQDLTLLVSMCRPQTNKKILHIATSLGVKKIVFVRGENIPKSYIQSSSLNLENIEKECLLAMAQTGDTIFPEIVSYKSIFECMKYEDFSDTTYSYLVADTHCQKELNKVNFQNINKIKAIAIGPESGWSEREIEYFHLKNFESIGLGERILRVEVATNYLLGRISIF